MEKNNIRPETRADGVGSIEYTLPQNKEQFREVLRQAQQGQYQTTYADEAPNSGGDYFERSEQTEQTAQPGGTYGQPAASPRESFADYRKPVYINRYAAPKKKLKPIAIILPAVILLAAAAAVVFFFFFNSVSYRKAEENYFGGIFSDLLNAADGLSAEKLSPSPTQINVSLTSPLGKAAGVDISDITLRLDTAMMGESIYCNSVIEAGKAFLYADGWVNRENKNIIILFPEISDIYAYYDYSSAEEEANGASEYIKAYGNVLSKASEVYFELTGEPEPIKEQEFTVNETSYTADKYVIRLDGVQLAKIEKALIDNLIENEKTAAALCKKMGYDNRELLLSDEKIKGELDRIGAVIEGSQTDSSVLEMNVYIKNKAIIGREIFFTDSQDTETDGQTERTEQAEKKARNGVVLTFFEIPTDKGSVTHAYFKDADGKETALTCEDEESKSAHSGKIVLSYADNIYTVNYSDFALTEELFRGKATLTSANDPALAAAMELKTENGVKRFGLSVPNIITATAEIKPSELIFKEPHTPADGEYADFSGYTNDKEYKPTELSAYASEKFKNDISRYVRVIMGLETAPENNGENNGNQDGHTEPPKPAVTENPPETSAEEPTPSYSEDNGGDSAASENTDTVSETDAPQNVTDGTASVTAPPQTEEITVSAAEPTPAPPSAQPSRASTLDTGDSQKLSGSQLDGFNRGNYYKAEIYVDGAANADSNVFVSEISGSFDGYIKGKPLQIDFAEGYEFDSALVVLTFPSATVTGGRHYPDSNVLRGLNRYRIMGMNNSDEYEREIEFYKYSDNQIGFIVDASGYYYLIDMDEYCHSVFGASPDSLNAEY